jgi:hypothetical protein
MNGETWASWFRSKSDTFLLLCVFVWLQHTGLNDLYHEVLGALLLALTGQNRGTPPKEDPKA